MNRRHQVKVDPRRELPAVGRLADTLRRSDPALAPWVAAAAARQAVDEARAALERGEALPSPDRRARELARSLAHPRPRRVVNATGVVLHTNLGRAPLAPGAAQAVAEAAASYSDLELDLASGSRGSRLAGIGPLLCSLSGAEAGLAVNNNAAAVMLAVNTLAAGREVVISRGELVEIGGSFRVPEVMERAGARLREVGTTNRTHPEDVRRAIGPDTGLLLKVHPSNFEQRGFVRQVTSEELAAIGREAGVPVMEDLGSATFVDLRAEGMPAESWAVGRLRSGVDLLCFSGDKLLGGPQAGLVLGRRPLVGALARNPMARALRLDKLSLAALDWTLRALAEGREAEIPVLCRLREPAAALEPQARELAERLGRVGGPELHARAEAARAPVGGGSLPGFELDTWVVALEHPDGAERLARRLREAPVPLLSRVRGGRVLLDLRTLLPGDAADCEKAVAALASGG